MRRFSSPASLRRHMRERRRSLTPTARAQAAKQLALQLRRARLWQPGLRVALYLAQHGELDPRQVQQDLTRRGIEISLPVLHPHRPGRLMFQRWRRDEPLAPNRFGIPEPRITADGRRPARWLDIVLVPLVACDAQGNRLGMGGGYFDRTFAFRRHGNQWCRPLLIGLAYEFQLVSKLPSREWDVPLDYIATEQRFIRCRRSRSIV